MPNLIPSSASLAPTVMSSTSRRPSLFAPTFDRPMQERLYALVDLGT
jgi:hypothetical protein